MSRRLSPLVLVWWSDAINLVLLVIIAAALDELHFSAPLIGWASGAGIVGMLGVVAFYRALADGTMGVIAPLTGLGVMVPVIVGVALGNRPDAAQIAGMVIGLVGVVLVSSGGERRVGGARVLLLAAIGAIAFGACFVFIDRSEPHGTVMTLLVMRLAVVVVLGTGGLITGRRPGLATRDIPAVAGIGALDVLANGFFAAASGIGQLAVVSVLSSLYPAVTTVLAGIVHGERLGRQQLAGVVAALAAIVLLAAGPSA